MSTERALPSRAEHGQGGRDPSMRVLAAWHELRTYLARFLSWLCKPAKGKDAAGAKAKMYCRRIRGVLAGA